MVVDSREFDAGPRGGHTHHLGLATFLLCPHAEHRGVDVRVIDGFALGTVVFHAPDNLGIHTHKVVGEHFGELYNGSLGSSGGVG